MGDIEDAVVYRDDEMVRRVRGHVVDDGATDGFVVIERRDGIVKIDRSVVLKVEMARRGR